PTEMIAVTVWEHLLQEGPHHEEVLYTEQVTQGYQGVYESGEGQVINVKAHQDGLQLTIAHEQLIVKQIDDHLFQLPDGKKIAFVLDSAGKVIGMHRGMRYLRKLSE